jgi:lysophospholipase L1-like esterase
MKEIVFIGDSLTEFFDWQNRLPGFSVQNLGSAGEPVEELLERLRRLRFFRNPDCLFLMTGINNLRRGDHEITGRYREVVDYLAAEIKDGVIALQSILPALRWVPPEVIIDANRAIRGMADLHGMEYLDLYSLFLNSDGTPDAELFDEDGIHLSAKGYTIWSRAVEDFLLGQK